ncbi:MAG: hypothetical protein WC877_00170 [Dehalococcoidales bacterium]|jgi:hypothetical protein
MITVFSKDLKRNLNDSEYDIAIHKLADKVMETAHLFNLSNCDVMKNVRDEVKNINNHGIYSYKNIEYPKSIEYPTVKNEINDKYKTISLKSPCNCQKSNESVTPQ